MATWFIDFDDVTNYTDHFTSRNYTANTVELVNDDGQQTLRVLAGTSPTSFKPLFFSFVYLDFWKLLFAPDLL